MGDVHIKFYEEKKVVITNVLDAAVKTLDFDPKDYISVKAQMMQIVEKEGYEGLGLGDVVSIANKLIAKVANHTGYVIVDSHSKKEKTEPTEEELVQQAEQEAISNIDGSTEDSGPSSKGNHGSVGQGAINRDGGERISVPKEPSVKGKEKLLQLMRLLPPLISRSEMELYSAQIKQARVGPPTGAYPPRTTGDIEKVIVTEAMKIYQEDFDRMVKEEPNAFYETITMSSGRTRRIEIADKFRKQLARCGSVAEFLSIKDLVGRHVKEQATPKKNEKKQGGLFFWRKD